MMTVLAWLSLIFAAVPVYVFLRNFSVFRPLPASNTDAESRPPTSVLIPARNEEQSIRACIESVLANHSVELEVVVLDDQSDDATADIVREMAEQDSRVRLEKARPLPSGWCGKQHACAQLGELARFDIFVFLDADVRLSKDALVRMLTEFQRRDVDLLSGFPLQRMETLAERMLIPLIHFILLSFLSLRRMRESRHPAFGAGCGQLFLTSREAYEAVGGHAAIRTSLHDGLKLPRLYRGAGKVTDLFDGTDIATCRMYHNAAEVWQGLKKNATEGAASANLIIPVTAMLFLGQVLPFCLALFVFTNAEARAALNGATLVPICLGMLLAWLPRFLAVRTFRQSLIGAILHPVSIVLFLCIQWVAFVGSFSKRPVSWKGRPYPAG